MSSLEQFEKVVTEAGAVAIRIMRGPKGAERLIIQTPGGLITTEVPLIGDLRGDIQHTTTSAQEIVASAKRLTAAPATSLSSSRSPPSDRAPPRR
jgi:4-hydroxyphenylpyruvate dioxygenase-like putative hemolysin